MNSPPPNSSAPVVTVDNVQLDQFETLVYSRQYEEAGRELLRILKRLKVGGEFANVIQTDETRPRLYSRLAAAITALMADPAFQLSQEGFDLLAVEHATFTAVFEASVFGTSDHLLRQFAVPDPGNPNRYQFSNPQNIGKMLLSYSLESDMELDFEAIFRAAPRLALPAFLGMLAHIVVLSPKAHRRREKLLTLGPLFEQVDLGEHMLAAVSDAYMYCSYAYADSKHEIKRSLNKMVRRLLESQIPMPVMPAQRKRSERPTVLIPIEWFTSLHAMYRCYAPSIRQLRERFRLVMIGRETEMDAVAKQLFDDVIEIKGANISIPDIVAKIRELSPDIIYYPSIGMAAWWMALSTVRLAPIQLMSLGHPATSNSEVIDYTLGAEGWEGDPSCFSEIAIVMPANALHYEMRNDAKFPPPNIRERPEVLRIAIPAMACKINAPFMETLQRIRQRAQRPVEFRFFPNMVGLTCYQITREIRRWLPEAIVYPRTDYVSYISRLSECDLHLSTFPFGGTNSNVDSMKLALPIVTLEGLETHSRTDAAMMRICGLPDTTIAYSEQEYERVAMKVINEDELRVSLARRLVGVDFDRLFFRGSSESKPFLDTFWRLYNHHERILASGQRYWNWEEFCALTD